MDRPVRDYGKDRVASIPPRVDRVVLAYASCISGVFVTALLRGRG